MVLPSEEPSTTLAGALSGAAQPLSKMEAISTQNMDL
jgi:hypothetical protein